MSTTSVKATEELTIKQKAEKGILPASLLLKDIVELWARDRTEQESIKKIMIEDIKIGTLVTENLVDNDNIENFIIHKNKFKNWFTLLRKRPIKECFHEDALLANWWADEAVEQIKIRTPLNTIHKNNAFPFYEAYRELEKRLTNLTYIEFGLFVFDGDIRIFEKSPDDYGNLKQLFGCGELNEMGIADTISCEATPLHLTLSRFCYAKEDIERLIPNYRYICFDDACKGIAYFANKPVEEIKNFLIRKSEYESISPYHPYCGFIHPEQESLLPDSAYPDYKIIQILRDDFGISENEYAFDIEIYLGELNAKGNSDDEIKPELPEDNLVKESVIPNTRKNGVDKINPLSAFKEIDNLTWEEVTIRFTSLEDVTIKARGTTKRAKFNNFYTGFDGRNNSPSDVWVYLRILAICNQNDNAKIRLYSSIPDTKTAMKRVRKMLKASFNMKKNPIAYKKYEPIVNLLIEDHVIEHLLSNASSDDNDSDIEEVMKNEPY